MNEQDKRALEIWASTTSAPLAKGIIIDFARRIRQECAKGEPVAWRWDQATYTELDVRGRSWEYNVFGTQKPNLPGMQRNVTPLYASPQPSDVFDDIAAWLCVRSRTAQTGGGQMNRDPYSNEQVRFERSCKDFCPEPTHRGEETAAWIIFAIAVALWIFV
jgi:hypothetical protein